MEKIFLIQIIQKISEKVDVIEQMYHIFQIKHENINHKI